MSRLGEIHSLVEASYNVYKNRNKYIYIYIHQYLYVCVYVNMYKFLRTHEITTGVHAPLPGIGLEDRDLEACESLDWEPADLLSLSQSVSQLLSRNDAARTAYSVAEKLSLHRTLPHPHRSQRTFFTAFANFFQSP